MLISPSFGECNSSYNLVNFNAYQIAVIRSNSRKNVKEEKKGKMYNKNFIINFLGTKVNKFLFVKKKKKRKDEIKKKITNK